jgi:hypothetical protein
MKDGLDALKGASKPPRLYYLEGSLPRSDDHQGAVCFRIRWGVALTAPAIAAPPADGVRSNEDQLGCEARMGS